MAYKKSKWMDFIQGSPLSRCHNPQKYHTRRKQHEYCQLKN